MAKERESLIILTPHSPGSFSPAGERIRFMARAGSKSFHEVTIMALWHSKEHACSSTGGGSNVRLRLISMSRVVPYPFMAILDPVRFLVLLAYSLFETRRNRPTFVLASMPPLEIGLAAWVLARLRRAKLVIDLRDDWESAIRSQLRHYFPDSSFRLLSAISKRLYLSAFAVLVATPIIGDNLRKERVTTPLLFIPNGADSAVFYPRSKEIHTRIRAKFSLPRDRIIIIYNGSGINPYYRLDLVLASVKELPESAAAKLFFLFYVYNGHAQLSKLQQQLGILASQLEIRDPLPREQLAEVTSACDVGLVPFDAKPYLLCARSTKMYEYLSCGLYTVSSGPLGGELDAFFSSHPELGLFTSPTALDYARVLAGLVDQQKSLFDEHSRKSRHEFIRMNYDRRITMTKAMNLLSVGGAEIEKEVTP